MRDRQEGRVVSLPDSFYHLCRHLPQDLTPKAQERSRWARGYATRGVQGLEPRSRRPRRVRQPQTPLVAVQRIQALREQYPRWGREKLRVLLEREGIHLSAKSIDRVIARLKARGVLHEPLRPRKSATFHPSAEGQRRPPDLVVDRPGALVQIDSKQVSLGGGKVVFHFGAVDCFTPIKSGW